MKKFSFPKSEKEWDEFLLQKYQAGLLDFSYSLVRLIKIENPRYGCECDDPEKIPDILKDGRRGWGEYFIEEKKRKKKLKDYIIDSLRRGLVAIGSPATDDFIIEAYQLGYFFERLDFEIESCRKTIELLRIWRRRGHPVSLKNKVAFVWAQVMRDKGKISWMLIEALISWFYERIRGSSYATLLEPGGGFNNVENFKKEYFLVIKDRSREKDLKKLAGAFFFSDARNRTRGLLRFVFNKKCVDILPIHAEKPSIEFPDGKRFYPIVPPFVDVIIYPKQKDDIRALKKYFELRKNQGVLGAFQRSPQGSFKQKRY